MKEDVLKRVVIEPFADRIEHEIGPMFRAIAPAMEGLCARYNPRELGLIRDFVAGVQKVMDGQTEKLRSGGEDAAGRRA